MNEDNFLYRFYKLYADGFRNMTIGKTLWRIILIKLVIIFVVLKLFFFPNFIKKHASAGDEPNYVEQTLQQRVAEN